MSPGIDMKLTSVFALTVLFSVTSLPKSERVVILNQAAAKRFWQGEDPLGRLARQHGDTRVIGII